MTGTDFDLKIYIPPCFIKELIKELIRNFPFGRFWRIVSPEMYYSFFSESSVSEVFPFNKAALLPFVFKFLFGI